MSVPIDHASLEKYLCDSRYILFHTYLQNLACSPPTPPCPFLSGTVKLLSLGTSSTYTPLPTALAPALVSLHSLGITFTYLLYVDGSEITSYLGVTHPTQSATWIQLLYQALEKEPAFTATIIPDEEVAPLLQNTLLSVTTYSALSSATCYPPVSETEDPFTLISASNVTAPYTLMCLATPMCMSDYLQIESDIGNLYMALYPYREQGFTSVCTNTNVNSDSSSNGLNTNENVSTSQNSSNALTNTTNNSSSNNLSLAYKATDKLNLTDSASTSDSKGNTENTSTGQSTSNSSQKATSKSTSDSSSYTNTQTLTAHYKQLNQEVERILVFAANLLSYFDASIAPPVFQLSTFFLGTSAATTASCAATYLYSFIQATPTNYPKSIATWTATQPAFYSLVSTLQTFTQPTFTDSCTTTCVSASLPWGLDTLTTLFCAEVDTTSLNT